MSYYKISFLSLIFSFIIFSGTIQNIILNITEPNENYTVSTFNLASGSYTLISLNNKETLLLDSLNNSINSKETISNIFQEKIFYDSKKDSATGLLLKNIENFNKSRYPEESTCRLSLGLENNKCVDNESCLVACYSSPICSAIAGAPGFIMEIKNWSDQSSDLTSLIVDGKNKMLEIKNSNSAEEAEEAFLSIEKKTNSILKNKLLDDCDECYTFCPIPNYDFSNLEESKTIISQLNMDLKPLENVNLRAAQIISNLAERNTYLLGRDGKFKNLSSKILFIKQEFNYQIGQSSNCINDTTLLNDFETFKDYISQMQEKGKEKKYLEMFNMEEKFDILSKELNFSIEDNLYNCKLVENRTNDARERVISLEKISSGTDHFSTQISALKARSEELKKLSTPPIQKENITPLIDTADNLKSDTNNLIVNVTLYLQEKNTIENNNTAPNPQNQSEQPKLKTELPCALPTILLMISGVYLWKTKE